MSKSRVLLLEADWVLAGNLRELLETKGYKVNWHVDPQSAISGADKSKPDIVVLDLILAGRSGIEFLYEFRSYPDWQELPVIVYSSVSKKELGDSLSNLDQLGIASYLHKSYSSMSNLAEAIDRALQSVHA